MFTYEDKFTELNDILSKKRGRWRLDYPAFEDVEQIIRRHVWIKFDLWDQTRDFCKWVNAVIEAQIINLVRNFSGKFAPPCARCDFNAGDNRCRMTESGLKCAECPFYKKWEKKKQDGYHIAFAQSVEFLSENGNTPSNSASDCFDLSKSVDSFHEKMRTVLPLKLYKIYVLFYIDGKTDLEVSQILGLKNNEKNFNSKRVPGYKQIHNLKDEIFKLAKEAIQDFDIIKI